MTRVRSRAISCLPGRLKFAFQSLVRTFDGRQADGQGWGRVRDGCRLSVTSCPTAVLLLGDFLEGSDLPWMKGWCGEQLGWVDLIYCPGACCLQFVFQSMV